jgi:hypothetical protein
MKYQYSPYFHTALYGTKSRLLGGAGIICVISFACYTYFLAASVLNVVVRKQIDTDISTIHTTLDELEARYIVATTRINEETAKERGFIEREEKTYLTAKSNTVVLSTNDES